MGDILLKYYSRNDVKKALLEISKDREVSVMYGKDNFGKRPDIIQFEGDILELAKKGATSFHISEELWSNPLELKPGMTKRQLDDLRIGWSCIIDIDTKFLEYSKATAELLIEALQFHNIENYSLKYSGSNGFHIGIPFKSFPEKVNNTETRLLFPDGVRVIASYLKELISKPLSERILNIDTIQEISKTLNKPQRDLIKNNIFDPYTILNIDTVLISNRHLFRAPYSLNEKKGLVSIPIKSIKTFKISQAKPNNVEVKLKFLDESPIEKPEASQLITQAFDWDHKNLKNQPIRSKIEFSLPKTAVKEENFPPCIKLLSNGLKEDGRKRAVFILINFLKHMGWDADQIKDYLLKWNKKNDEPLRDGYILSQINWSKKQKQNILPPNCNSEVYYKGIGVKCPDNICQTVKNPVNYALRKFRNLNQTKKPKGKK